MLQDELHNNRRKLLSDIFLPTILEVLEKRYSPQVGQDILHVN